MMHTAKFAVLVAVLISASAGSAAGKKIGSVQLVEQDTPRQGRLEVRWGSRPSSAKWTRVCLVGSLPSPGEGDAFDSPIATVICKQLGYPGGKLWNYDMHDGDPYYVPLELSCTGKEKSLSECTYKQYTGPEADPCEEGSDVEAFVPAVKCEGSLGKPRLAGGKKPNNGTLQVQWGGNWRELIMPCCEMDSDVGSVVCRELGYSGGKFWSASRSRTKDVTLRLDCKGTEKSLSKCSYKYVADDDYEVVGLSCTGKPAGRKAM